MVIGVINQLSHTFGPRLFIGTLPPKKEAPGPSSSPQAGVYFSGDGRGRHGKCRITNENMRSIHLAIPCLS